MPRKRQALLGMHDTDAENTRVWVVCKHTHCLGVWTKVGNKWKWEMLQNMESILKLRGNNTKPMVERKSNKTTEYFLSDLTYESDRKMGDEFTQWIHKDFDDVFNNIGCFEGIFSLQLKPDSKPYQALLRCMAYALQRPFQEELERLQKLDIIAPLGIDKTPQRCNSFVLVPKANGKIRLYLGPVCLNQALIRSIHRRPTLNNILPKLNNAKYLSLIDASSGYQNVKFDEKSSYLTTFGCQFGWFRYKWIPFGVAPAGTMFQGKLMKFSMTCQMYWTLKIIVYL